MDPERSISAEEILTHSVWMRKLAVDLVRDSAKAEDLVQDTLVSWALRGDIEGEAVRPWLVRVMTNLARSGWRSDDRREQRERLVARSEVEEAEDVTATLEIHDLLMGTVKGLDPDLRTVIVRHYFEGEALAEVARHAGLPESTVRNRLKRALGELKVKLDRECGERSNWVAIFVAFAKRTPAPAALPAGATASMSMLWILGWIGAAAALLIGSSLALWSWKERQPALATQAEMFAAASSSSTARAEESNAPSTSGTGNPADAGHRAALDPTTQSRPPDVLSAMLDARIVDPRGDPIAGAELSVIDRSDGEESRAAPELRARSGNDGRVHLELRATDLSRSAESARQPQGQWRIGIAVSAADRATHSDHIELSAGRPTTLPDIVLAPGGSLDGRVATADGSPLPVCWVDIVPVAAVVREGGRVQSVRHGEQVAHVRVARDGSFEAAGVPLGTYHAALAGELEGWIAPVSEPIEVRVGETRTLPDLVLEHRRGITGSVRRADLTPGAGVWIAYIDSERAETSVDEWKTVRADKEGRFEISADGPRAYDLYVRSDDGGDVWIREVSPGSPDLDVRLSAPAWIELAVSDEHGAPIERFTTGFTWARGARPFASSTGKHAGGKSRVAVHAKPFFVTVSAEERLERELGPIDPVHYPDSLAVALAPMAAIRGRVSADGVAIADAAVELHTILDADSNVACNGFPCRLEADPRFGRKRTDRDGRFELTERKRDRYVLIVRAPDFADYESAPFDHDPALAREELDIVLSRGGALEGSVRMGPDAWPTGLIVGISRGDVSSRDTRVGPDGKYRFEHLAAGRWSIRRCEKSFTAEGGVARSTVGGFDPSLVFFGVEEGRTTRFDLDLSGATCVLDGRLTPLPCADCGYAASLTPLPIVPGPKHAAVALASDGSFRVEARVLGRHRLVVAQRSAHGFEQRIEQEIDMQRGTNPWSLALATGTLTGDAAPGTRFQHTWSNADGVRCTTQFAADSDGRFRISGIPAGNGRLTFTPAGSATVESDVDVPAGAALQVKAQ
jgi:RNA polymerase sigma-70 factor (ECF subfamily)